MSYIYVSETLNGGIQHYADYTKVELKPLGDFVFNDIDGTDADVPAMYRALDGKRVMLEGFMNPLNSSGEGTSEFEFVYNLQICCFSGPPQVQERVYVHVPDHGSVPVYEKTFLRIVGTLHAHVLKEAGKVQSVYTLDLEQLRVID